MANYPVAAYGTNPLGSNRNFDAMFKCMVIALLVMLVLPQDVWAQGVGAGGTATGDSVWASVKGMLFSGWGMLYALAIVFAGAFIWARRGIGEGILVMCAGFATFFIPALIMAAMQAGKTAAA